MQRMHSWGENGARNAQVEADQHTCERCNACMRHERERESLTWKEIGGVGGMRSRHCPRSLQRKESKSEESPRAKNMQSRDHVTYMTHQTPCSHTRPRRVVIPPACSMCSRAGSHRLWTVSTVPAASYRGVESTAMRGNVLRRFPRRESPTAHRWMALCSGWSMSR